MCTKQIKTINSVDISNEQAMERCNTLLLKLIESSLLALENKSNISSLEKLLSEMGYIKEGVPNWELFNDVKNLYQNNTN